MTRLLEQDPLVKERRWQNCNSHSMNFELSSGLQGTLDSWCLSPRSKELNGGLIIRRDCAGEYKLEPIGNPLSNIDPVLIMDDAWSDVSSSPRRLQARSFDMIHEHRAADAEVFLNRAIFDGASPQDNPSLDPSEQQSMDFYDDVVWKQSLNPWIEQEYRSSGTEIYYDDAVSKCSSPQDSPSLGLFEEQSMDFHDDVVWNQRLSSWVEKDHTASDTAIYLDGAAIEDTPPQDNRSIGYYEGWSMDRNERKVAQQLGGEWIRQEQRSPDMDIAFHGTALNVYSLSPLRFAVKRYKAALSDMLQSLPENPSLHLPAKQGMDIYKDVMCNYRTSPWIKEDHRSSAMEIYFDEAVTEAYPLSPLKPSSRPNKASLSYILQSPPFEEINDRSPPSSPTKPRCASINNTIDDPCGPVYFDEAMRDAHTPSPLMSAIETNMALSPYISRSSPAEVINDKSPALSQGKPKETSPDENIDDDFGSVYFGHPLGHNYAIGLTESKIPSGCPIGDTSSTQQAARRRPGRLPGTSNKKKTLSATQSKKIAASALKRIEILRKRTKAQAELPMTADPQKGNASKRRKKRRGELRSDHKSKEQLRRESGEFKKRINVLGRIAAYDQQYGGQYDAEKEENQENWERVAYDPDL